MTINNEKKISTTQPSTDKTAQPAQEPEFQIQRLYVKDLSFEAPGSPEVFRAKWEPQVNLDLNTKTAKLSDNVHEVVLTLTVTVTTDGKTAFLAEAKQAGIFGVRNFPEKDLDYLLGSFCPNVLFPYARETISDLVTRGGFPTLYLAPVNFELLYQQQQQARAEGGASAGTAAAAAAAAAVVRKVTQGGDTTKAKE